MGMKDGSINSSNTRLFEYLEIDTCPSLIAFPDVELPTTLKELKIWRCEKLESLPGRWCTMIQIPPPPPVVVFMSWSLGYAHLSHSTPQTSFPPPLRNFILWIVHNWSQFQRKCYYKGKWREKLADSLFIDWKNELYREHQNRVAKMPFIIEVMHKEL